MVSKVVSTVEGVSGATATRIVAQVDVLARLRSMSVLVVTKKIRSSLERASRTARVKTLYWPVVTANQTQELAVRQVLVGS